MRAILEKEAEPLGGLAKFQGAGVYAIYYSGGLELYKRIRCSTPVPATGVPVYVGKAVPDGARKGVKGLEKKPGNSLFKRLSDHAKSVDAALDLELGDFWCRHLVVDDIWIPLGEALLIARFTPVWNTIVDGFGNHNPGKGRREGLRPRWDTLHPGREWATKFKERPESRETIANEVRMELEGS